MRKKKNTEDESIIKENIIEIHNFIETEYSNALQSIKNMISCAEHLRDLAKKNQNYINRLIIKKEIKRIKLNISDIQKGITHNRYLRDVGDIIEKYKQIISKPIIINSSNIQQSDTYQDIDRYIEMFNKIVIEYYPDIARIKLQTTMGGNKILQSNIANYKCIGCNSIGQFKVSDSYIICSNCARLYWKNVNTSQFENRTDRIGGGGSTKYVYMRETFFKNWVKKYQGKHNPKIPPDVYEKIYNWMGERNISEDRLEKTALVAFLRSNNLSNHVEDINFLYYDIVKIYHPPDISKYEAVLFADYSVFDENFETILEQAKNEYPFITRENSTNSFYTLCKLLEKQNYIVSDEDKEIFLKFQDKIIEHDLIWKTACEVLGWNYSKTI